MVLEATAVATIDARNAKRIGVLVGGVVVVVGLLIRLLLVAQA